MLTPTSSPDHGLLEADERAGGSVDGEDGEAGAAGCFGYRGELRRAVRVRHDAADAPDRAARRGERPGYFRGGDPRVLYCTVRSTLSRLDTSTYRVLTCHLCRVCGFSLGCDGLEANAQREIISASRHGGVPRRDLPFASTLIYQVQSRARRDHLLPGLLLRARVRGGGRGRLHLIGESINTSCTQNPLCKSVT